MKAYWCATGRCRIPSSLCLYFPPITTLFPNLKKMKMLRLAIFPMYAGDPTMLSLLQALPNNSVLWQAPRSDKMPSNILLVNKSVVNDQQ